MTRLAPVEFFKRIWPSQLLTKEVFEMRIIRRTDQKITREFFTTIPAFLAAAEKHKGCDIYFGVSTRFGRGGKKQDCYRTQAVWADLDDRRIDDCNFSPRPDLLVNSGGGVHAYWVLNKPLLIRGEKWEALEATNRGLCQRVGGDNAAIDCTRILRVPGCYNTKYTPFRIVSAYAL